MAYHTRSRDPLLDSNMQAAIEKRGKELIGILLICFGLAGVAMIASYTPDDPNWMVSTDAPVQNWMGRTGASIAAPLFMIVGWGAWAIAGIALVWGVRFALHSGEERAVGRLIFAPIAVAFVSIYAATLIPGKVWHSTHSFGLGGLFGDTVMGALLTLLPVGSHLAVKLISVLAALAMVGLGAFVLGFTRTEMFRALRFSVVGIIMVYGAIATAMGRGVSNAAVLAKEKHAARSQARAERREEARLQAEADAAAAEAEAARLAAQPVPVAPALVAEPPEVEDDRGGFLSRMPSLIRRTDPMPEPELVEAPFVGHAGEAPGDDRIRAKIADVIRARSSEEPPQVVPADKPLTRGRGHGPQPLVFNPEPQLSRAPAQGFDLRPEPPLTAGPAAFVEVDMDEAEVLEDAPVAEAALPLAEPAPAAVHIPVAEPRKVVQNPPRKAPAPSKRAQAEAQPTLNFEDNGIAFELPPLNLLENPQDIPRHHLSDEALEENARMLENVLDDYGVKGEIVSVRPGPVVTMYELEPAPGLKASRVIGLADDIARSMSALSARVSTVPGRSVIGIELPNENREKVVLREILASRDFGDSTMSVV